jgi:phytoene dehydrogenase-like protein
LATDYDFIVVGSGHNGLTAAAYLAKAGLKILVLERNDWFGGGVVTKEILARGFKFDLHSSLHVNIQANPLILNDELGLLSKYGLQYLHPTLSTRRSSTIRRALSLIGTSIGPVNPSPIYRPTMPMLTSVSHQ